MSELSYGFMKQINGFAYHEAVEKVTAELKKEGFGVLTTIDVKETLKKKIDADFRRYIILGACNPTLAHKALKSEAHIGLLLPCNVVVQELDDGNVVISIADPHAMFRIVDNDAMKSVADEAEQRLRRVLDAVS